MDRAKRRQLLKDDQALIGKPFELANNARAVQANTRHLALLLLDSHIKRRASRAAALTAQLLDATTLRKAQGPVACSKGCYYCCKTYVSATIPEILRLAHAVRGKTEKQARVAAAGLASQAIPAPDREIRRVVCPILEDKACSEYAARPLVCRAVLSSSLPTCLRIFEENSGEAMPHADNTVDIRTYIVLIMQSALVLSGLPHFHYEMNQALATALRHDDAEARWLAGEPIFADVPVDPSELQPSPLTDLVRRLVNVVQPTL